MSRTRGMPGAFVVFDRERHRLAGDEIAGRKAELASSMVELQFSRVPDLRESLGAAGVEKSFRDADYNMQSLAEAIATGDPAAFGAYLAWLDGVLAAAGLKPAVLDVHLECMADTLSTYLPPDTGELAIEYVRAGREAVTAARTRAAR